MLDKYVGCPVRALPAPPGIYHWTGRPDRRVACSENNSAISPLAEYDQWLQGLLAVGQEQNVLVAGMQTAKAALVQAAPQPAAFSSGSGCRGRGAFSGLSELPHAWVPLRQSR